MGLNNKHQKTLDKVFSNPVPQDIKWSDVESLFRALGCEITEGRGSRVRVELNGVLAVFHRPHPSPDTDRGAVKSVKRFLETAGVENGI